VPDLRDTAIPGCLLLAAPRRGDERGWFQKVFHHADFAAAGLNTSWREEYLSLSDRDVVRGMHFQLPPDDHEKVVTCVAGRVTDVVLDLRRDSPALGRHLTVELSGEEATSVYIPRGCAHGFVAREPGSILFYQVATEYSPERDTGIAWDSFGFDWNVAHPVLSPRDQKHPRLADFLATGSPFVI
jgi:dTDP-4-dehydrorhamnose 3,5-epimerase